MCWTLSVSSVVRPVYCVCMRMAFQEIRVGRPDGFNVTTRLWKRCVVEIWSKYKHAGAASSARATADPPCGSGCYELDEKHIVTYILSCKPPPPPNKPLSLCGFSFFAERVKDTFSCFHFCGFKLKTENRTDNSVTRSYRLYCWSQECCGPFGAWNRSWSEPGALQNLKRTPGGLENRQRPHRHKLSCHFPALRCLKALNQWGAECFLRPDAVKRTRFRPALPFFWSFWMLSLHSDLS